MLRRINVVTPLFFGCVDIAWMGERIRTRPEAREKVEDEGGQRKLHQHVHACCEEREVEIEVLRGEHPLVVDGDGEGEKVPASIVLVKAQSPEAQRPTIMQ